MPIDTNATIPPLAANALTIRFIATGLVRAFRYAEKHGALHLPYENDLQTGLNRLLLASMQSNIASSKTIPELISWCYRPLSTWGFDCDTEDITDNDVLLVHGVPTPFCEELACLVPDVEADITERRFLESVMNLCRDENAPQTYVAFRTLLIEKQVLSSLEFLEQTGSPELHLLRTLLEEAYESIPAALVADDGTVRTCGRCGNVLVPLQNGQFRCIEPDCDTGDGVEVGTLYNAAKDRPLRLKRGLRIFVSAPGRAELSLKAKLIKRGISVEMWPAFDRYDLRLTFPDGTVWAVDVKDWHSPYLLARKLTPNVSIPASPAWQLGFFVFPDKRRENQRDYKRVIENRCRFPSNITVCFESEFLRRVNRKLREADHA